MPELFDTHDEDEFGPEPSLDDWNATMEDDTPPPDISQWEEVPTVPVVTHEPEPMPMLEPLREPSWRDCEPPIVHSVKFIDVYGRENLHVIRGDNLDEVLVHVRKLNAVLDAAKAKARQSAQSIPATVQHSTDPGVKPCPLPEHSGAEMESRISKKSGKPYWSHRMEDGELCFGWKQS